MILDKSQYCHGIDVSNNNGTFPWKQWAGHIDFAMAKSSEGTHFLDNTFPLNWQAMDELALWRFAYHYVHVLDSSPAMQARYFTEAVRDRVTLRQHDHFVADIESEEASPEETSWWMHVFCREMNRINPGHRILPYTYTAYADAGYTAMLGPWHLWEACWDAPSPPPCGPWKTWAFWQYSGRGTDLNVFNGDRAALEKFCTTTG